MGSVTFRPCWAGHYIPYHAGWVGPTVQLSFCGSCSVMRPLSTCTTHMAAEVLARKPTIRWPCLPDRNAPRPASMALSLLTRCQLCIVLLPLIGYSCVFLWFWNSPSLCHLQKKKKIVLSLNPPTAPSNCSSSVRVSGGDEIAADRWNKNYTLLKSAVLFWKHKISVWLDRCGLISPRPSGPGVLRFKPVIVSQRAHLAPVGSGLSWLSSATASPWQQGWPTSPTFSSVHPRYYQSRPATSEGPYLWGHGVESILSLGVVTLTSFFPALIWDDFISSARQVLIKHKDCKVRNK